MELRYKSGASYTLILNLYFDDVHGDDQALSFEVLAGIFDKATHRPMQEVVLPLVSNTFVNYTNPACTQPTLRTRRLVYRRDITLDPQVYTSMSGYYAAVELCCRNEVISNIADPGGAAQTFYLEFPAVERNGQPFIDSTPQIFPPLNDYACKGELFYYDFGGVDPDGDSLAYSMVTPLNGHAIPRNPSPQPRPSPYSLITWLRGFSEQAQLPGNPTMQIDAHTGRLTVRPSEFGLFVFGVRCEEYRQGVKIGETRRDFQLFVLSCEPNTPPSVQVYLNGSTRAYQPGRDTLRILPDQNPCLQVRFTDSDRNSRLTVSVRPVNYSGPLPTWSGPTSGTVRASNVPDTLQSTLCFPSCQDTEGKVLLLDVMVADNGCSLPKRDTVRLAFTAVSAPNVPPDLTSSFPPSATDAPTLVEVPLGSVFTASLLGVDKDGNPLVLSAAGQGFDLTAAGMEFSTQNGPGRSTGTFRWQANCEAAELGQELTVQFQLQESTTCPGEARLLPVRFAVVPVLPTTSFLPPNVFTPNGDGVNDEFTLPDLPADYCDARFAGIQIFSRWGNEVYHSGERTFRWPGAGTASTYYYLITYTDGRRFKGWVTAAP